MNKQDIAIVALLAAALLGWLFHQNQQTRRHLEIRARAAAAAATNLNDRALSADAQASAAFAARPAAMPAPTPAEAADEAVAATEPAPPAAEPGRPEETLVLSNAQMRLTLSSKGGTIREAVLPHYRETVDRGSAPVRLDFMPSPALALQELPGLGMEADFDLLTADDTAATLRRATPEGWVLERRITLRPDYRIAVRDTLTHNGDQPRALPAGGLSLGAMHRGASKNDTLGVDALGAQPNSRGGLGKVRHWDTKLNGLFTGGRGGGGCGGAPAADGLPLTASTRVDTAQTWLALKSRFFVQAFISDATNTGYQIAVARHAAAGPLRLQHVAATIHFPAEVLAPGQSLARDYVLYVGPKKLSLLQRFGPRTAEIMQFGTFKWMCVILVPILNFFHALIPNYGIAIILLTLLVRVVFWPLTHKSTESMKRMQALQPKLKEIQAQFKSDPQKLQQETWKLYRENKVNPMSSCLPMLIQIPVFIALFTVLRSAVELRFAPFLWIVDLSEPENLLAGVLPLVPALNILPFFMAGTMLLQSRLTPAMGDPAQQKMMMWMMPGMMLVMFYSMPSALVLYWTVSQVLAIAQLLWQKRKQAAAQNGASPSAGDPSAPLSRQARRRLAR
ncbi:MAG: membrane protein insertase YidC [Lentisphaerae bacterium]|nr:membrane protein insertase YidC [Lentisphaerota bacterium]